ncbi:MAG TPA: N-acetylmuramoyl-L-alanine amidase [Terriglobales bacterium]
MLLLSGYANEEQRVAIYSTAANYTLPVISRNNHDYVGLFEVLEPLGTVTAKVDGARWKIRYGKVEGEFTNEKARAKVRGRNIELPANFILENGRGLVPLNSLSILLPPFLGGPVNFHESSRRLFIGNVAVHFSAQLNRTSEPPFLVLEFTSPVNPTISTGPGQLRMTFNREPLVPPGSQTLKFDSPMIPSATYSEGNGAAEIQINGSVPLFASFSNNGRRITIAPAPQPEKQAVQPPTPPGGLMPATPAPSAVPSPAAYFAVIDPSHGGEERGAALSDQISEKDVTLAFARRLRRDLEARGITSLLVRDSDSVLSLDQRATIANAARSKIYICIHAASQGNGVRLYSGLIPAGDASRGPFLDWNTAQGSFLPLTQAVESQVAAELQKKQISARTLAAPLRPLNNIVAPALAIEIAPPGSQVADVNSAAYQDSIATAVVAAVVGARARLESGR